MAEGRRAIGLRPRRLLQTFAVVAVVIAGCLFTLHVLDLTDRDRGGQGEAVSGTPRGETVAGGQAQTQQRLTPRASPGCVGATDNPLGSSAACALLVLGLSATGAPPVGQPADAHVGAAIDPLTADVPSSWEGSGARSLAELSICRT